MVRPGENRRKFLLTVANAGLALVGYAPTASAGDSKSHPKQTKETEEPQVTPGEDLMQEHGLLEGVLLIYEEHIRRFEQREKFDLSAVTTAAANIIRRFIEEYHEQQEERFVFPRLEKAGKQVQLVGILRLQHLRVREVTSDVIRLAQTGSDNPLSGPLIPRLRNSPVTGAFLGRGERRFTCINGCRRLAVGSSRRCRWAHSGAVDWQRHLTHSLSSEFGLAGHGGSTRRARHSCRQECEMTTLPK